MFPSIVLLFWASYQNSTTTIFDSLALLRMKSPGMVPPPQSFYAVSFSNRPIVIPPRDCTLVPLRMDLILHEMPPLPSSIHLRFLLPVALRKLWIGNSSVVLHRPRSRRNWNMIWRIRFPMRWLIPSYASSPMFPMVTTMTATMRMVLRNPIIVHPWT